MTSFSGKPELTDELPIANDGYFPDLSMAEFMDKYRIPAEYDNAVISQGLSLGMVRTNDFLQEVKKKLYVDDTCNFSDFLDAHPNYAVNGEDWALFEYKHAVFCRAKAFLLEQFSSLNRRKDAENEAKESPAMEAFWLNESKKSIFNLQAKYLSKHKESTTANTDLYISLI